MPAVGPGGGLAIGALLSLGGGEPNGLPVHAATTAPTQAKAMILKSTGFSLARFGGADGRLLQSTRSSQRQAS